MPTENEDAPGQPSPPAPGQPPAPPPAATTVLSGKTEREIALENQLAEESVRRKKAETDASYAQDEARRLKGLPPTPATPPPDDRSDLERFLDGDDE